MKKHLIIIGTLMVMMSSSLSAQYCPPNSSPRWVANASTYNVSEWNTFGNSASIYTANSPIQRLAYSFSAVLSEGWRIGKLTEREIRGLERDFRNVEREIKWASANNNISFHEQSTIDLYIRRLERNIRREWHDGDIRIG